MRPRNDFSPLTPVKRPIKLNEIIPGDILLFRPSKQVWFVQQVIMASQALTRQKHGHYDTTHVAICIDRNEDGHPVIAHVHEKHDTMGFIQEKLEELFGRDDGDRPFLTFRHENPFVRRRVAITAGDRNNHNMGFTWNLKMGIKSLFGYTDINPAEEVGLGITYSAQTICSTFVIDTLKQAHHHRDKLEYYPAIRSTSSPKALEAYLYKSHAYHEYCYLGEQPVETIKTEIESQIARFKKRPDSKSKVKYEHACMQYQLALDTLDAHPELDELASSLVLIKSMLPVFKQSTGLGFFNTTSYAGLLDVARKMGIFQRDIDGFSLTDLKFPGGEVKLSDGLDQFALSI